MLLFLLIVESICDVWSILWLGFGDGFVVLLVFLGSMDELMRGRWLGVVDLDGTFAFMIGDFSIPLLFFVDSELLEACPENYKRFGDTERWD